MSCIHRTGLFLSLLKYPSRGDSAFLSDSKVFRCLLAESSVAEGADSVGQPTVGRVRSMSGTQETAMSTQSSGGNVPLTVALITRVYCGWTQQRTTISQTVHF